MTGIEAPYAVRNGILHTGGVAVTAIARKFGTPVYVMDEGRIRANVRRLHRAFASRYADFHIHYAVKANNNLAILGILRSEGVGADCSAPTEIWMAKKAGWKPEEMLYTGNYQSEDELAYAVRSRVTINLDDDALLPRMLRAGKPPRLSFRINPGVGEGGTEGLVFGGEGSKFGIPAERALSGYAAAKKAGISRFGIHMMTGSNVLRPEYFPMATARLLDMAGAIAKKTGIRFEFVNIGGGFGVPYRPSEKKLDIEKTARLVVDMFERKTREHRLGRPKLFVEPGRYLVCDAGILLTRVEWVKRVKTVYAGTDAGMQTLLRPALYNAYHPIVLASRTGAGRPSPVTVCGQICENTDVVTRGRRLPPLRPGDLLAIFDAGAYGWAMSSQYNSRPRAGEVLVSNGKAVLIRTPETWDDLVRNVKVPTRLKG